MSAIVALHDITFTYTGAAQPALAGLMLELPAGQICALVGPAGSGKSTLCALCGGFIPEFYAGLVSGSATVGGQDVIGQPVSALVRHVGLVGSSARSQLSGACFSVFEEVGFGLANLGLPTAEIIERVEWALAALRLDDLRDRSPYALSGGQQQRTVLAAALAMRPPVLLLDEPTAQLDPLAARELADILRELSRGGVTVLLAEHRLEWVAECADRVVALDAGRLIADGAPQVVLTDPRLRDNGTGWPRPARLAARLRAAGRWPGDRPLPVTAAGLLHGLEGPVTTPWPDKSTAAAGALIVAGARFEGGGVPAQHSAQPPAAPASLAPGLLAAPAPDGPAPRAEQPIVQADSAHFSYQGGVLALRGVSLRVNPGERVALLGRNGAGKSTLVRHLNGLLRPSHGAVYVAGEPTGRTSVAWCARHVGVVFQDIRNQLFARSVRDELRFGPRNLGFSPARTDALVDRALGALGLAGLAAAHPYDLAPSQRRLVAVAAGMALDSALLVLDEPTTGLDAASVERLLALIAALADQGKSVLLVSHDLDLCFEACERVVLLSAGQVALDASWRDLGAAEQDLLERAVGLPLALRAGL